jgi:hypothetical protein
MTLSVCTIVISSTVISTSYLINGGKSHSLCQKQNCFVLVVVRSSNAPPPAVVEEYYHMPTGSIQPYVYWGKVFNPHYCRRSFSASSYLSSSVISMDVLHRHFSRKSVEKVYCVLNYLLHFISLASWLCFPLLSLVVIFLWLV